MEPGEYDYSKDQHYQDGRETLAEVLDEFKQLEKDEPEVAARIGFLGYATLQVMMNLGGAQVELLKQIVANTTPAQSPGPAGYPPMQVI